MYRINKISVIGAGSWGTAIANLLSSLGNNVLLYHYNSDFIHNLSTTLKHPHLKDVTINSNIKFSSDLSNLKRCQIVFLSQDIATDNQNKGDFGNLKKLRELYLNYNQITYLPDSFGKLENLEILLIYYNQLTSLPRSIGNLKSLQVLYSSNNQMTTLPETIANLHSLHKLWINSNQLSTLPLSLCELPPDCDINVSYNCLSEEYHYRCIGEAGHAKL